MSDILPSQRFRAAVLRRALSERGLSDLEPELGKLKRPCVTVFGSARYPEDHPYYKLAREAGTAIARLGLTTMTGGGPGIMEAANRGAKEAGGPDALTPTAVPAIEADQAAVHPRAIDLSVLVRERIVRARAPPSRSA